MTVGSLRGLALRRRLWFCSAVKQVFETYVYAQLLSRVRHEPFIDDALEITNERARSTLKVLSRLG
jgi:hypothetical protein